MFVLGNPQWSLDFKTSLRPISSTALFQTFKKHISLSLCFLIFGSGFTVQIKLTVSKRYMRYKTTLSLLFSLSWVFFWFYVSQVPIKLQSSNDNNLYFFFHTLLTISTYSLSNLLNFKCKDLISFEVSFQSFAYEVIRN